MSFESGDDSHSGSSWEDAKATIQAGVDAAVDGDTVLVTNGVYNAGGAMVAGSSLMSRVAISNAVLVVSVNGPDFTTLEGTGPLGAPGAVRCAYVGANARIAGFTLSGGATLVSGDVFVDMSGGGAWCESSAMVSNCVLTGNSALYFGGGAYGGTLKNCTLSSNTVSGRGGGAHAGLLYECDIRNNLANEGGGTSDSTLYACTLSSNTAGSRGGGAFNGTLNYCTLNGNQAPFGGGTRSSTLNGCRVSGNSATTSGGGMYAGVANSCVFADNTSGSAGGGAYTGTLRNCGLTGNHSVFGGGAIGAVLENCTLSGNTAREGGGDWGSSIRNCILYHNRAVTGANFWESELVYSCTTPFASGSGNITNAPALLSPFHIAADSPCAGRGNSLYASGTDIDGESWRSPPSIGADEPYGNSAGFLSTEIRAEYDTISLGFRAPLTGFIQGAATASAWDFGDGTIVSNQAYTAHAWSSTGTYSVVLTAWNADHPEGVSATSSVTVLDATYYVDAASAAPQAPYASWVSAANTIQDAVDAALPGARILVTNGVYETGGVAVFGSMTNRVALTNGVQVISVNGPEVTIIRGNGTVGPGAVRCAYVGAEALLHGFTLTNGATLNSGTDAAREQSGGGAWCESTAELAECILVGNAAADRGGGAYGGNLVACRITGNSAGVKGGGVMGGTLNRCTIIDNHSRFGGGVSGSLVRNSTVAGNRADSSGGGAEDTVLESCVLTANRAVFNGGGAWKGTLSHCTVTGNEAAIGGGASESTLNNCIIYFNRAANNADNHDSCTIAHSCTTPLAEGAANIANDPILVSPSHISENSPCVGLGRPEYASGLDIDGESWRTSPASGADEPYGTSAGELTVAIDAEYSVISTGFSLPLVGVMEGAVTASAWDFGDGTLVSNQAYTAHAWTSPGLYAVVLTAYNADYPEGITATLPISVLPVSTTYADVDSDSPLHPFTNWASAATSIQDAVDATVPGSLVLVAPGKYDAGLGYIGEAGQDTRLVVRRGITVRSAEGPAKTLICGAEATQTEDAVRCVYLGFDCSLEGFTLTNGVAVAGHPGGGVWSEPGAVMSNCVFVSNSGDDGGGARGGTLIDCTLQGNSADEGGGTAFSSLRNCRLASNSAINGGGCYESTLQDCALWGNVASTNGGGAFGGSFNRCVFENNVSFSNGGGAFQATARNCLFVQNEAQLGGGVFGGDLINCTIAQNSASGSGGGAYSGSFNNSIIFANTSPVNLNYDAGSFEYSCTFPHPGGSGNITNNPQFVDAGNDDYRLQPGSPCIDTGEVRSETFFAADLDGGPRLLGDNVDMGAYEFRFAANLRAYLEGAWDGAAMRTGLNLPTNSPYAGDRVAVPSLPSNAVDWVLVELRPETNAVPVLSRSALLLEDGRVVRADGGEPLYLESKGEQYVVIKHRNHLAAMSPVFVTTNRVFSHDFTLGPEQFFGGESGGVSLETGAEGAGLLSGLAWGLPAGDADGDGLITDVDPLMVSGTLDESGYLLADLDLDGLVSALEVPVAGLRSPVPAATTPLYPLLVVSPQRRTVISGDSVIFTASGEEGTARWFIVENQSGASITQQGLYTAGISNGVDLIQGWDGRNRLGRAFVNVIGEEDISRFGKAVIVAGGKSLDDPVWRATEFLAAKAYDVLRYRGFVDETIEYLGFDPSRPNVDGGTGSERVEDTFTNWVTSASSLFVYLANHGSETVSGEGFFRLSGSELLGAAKLDGWLDRLQTGDTNIAVTVLLDFCYSGSFLAGLTNAPPGARRQVMASTSPGELTYFIAGGLVSFSETFFNGMLLGLSFESAYVLAREAMLGYQSATRFDPGQLGAGRLGAENLAGKDLPVIGRVLGNQRISEGTTATLWADDVSAVYEIDRVWSSVLSPSHRPETNSAVPVVDVPELDLTYRLDSGRYEAQFDGFTENGSYRLTYYAKDIWESVSLPRISQVVQAGYREDFLLIAGGETNAALEQLTRLAYRTARTRLFEPEQIHVYGPWWPGGLDLDGDGVDDVDGPPTLANIEGVFGDTNRLGGAESATVYCVGPVKNNGLILSEFETLTTVELDGLLDGFQQLERPAQVILEFDGSGGWVSGLTAPQHRERILIASTGEGRSALTENAGLVSFSQYFFWEVFQGQPIGNAVTRARKTIRRASGRLRQRAEIDDDGDGISNEKNIDGVLSQLRHVGPAFVTGDDIPFIGSVIPATITTNSALTIWAADVLDVHGISNVWCFVTPPDYAGAEPLRQVDLAYVEGPARWEATLDGLDREGLYVLTFYVSDSIGQLSAAVQTDITRTDNPLEVPDLFEPDDSTVLASVYENMQVHTFHVSNDVDWVRFYAVSNFAYDIETVHHGTNIDTVVEVYYEHPDGTLTNIDTVDEFGFDEGELTGLDFPQSGFYLVKVSPFRAKGFLAGAYTLVVDIPVGEGTFLVFAVNALTGNPLPGPVFAKIDGVDRPPFAGQSQQSYVLDPGEHTIEIAGVSGHVSLDPNPRSVVVDDIDIGVAGFSTFRFLPYVTASGRVRDAWTGAWLQGASVEFETTTGVRTNRMLDRFPDTAPISWVSENDGRFPSNVILYADHDFDLQLSLEGYTNLLRSVSGGAPGDHLALGTVFLVPLDTDGNGISDSWELDIFGSNVAAEADNDGDGHPNRLEFLLGTDPMNPANVLAVDPQGQGGTGLRLRWPVSQGRVYDARAREAVGNGDWPVVFGPRTAEVGQVEMEFTDTAVMTNRFYRIGVRLP